MRRAIMHGLGVLVAAGVPWAAVGPLEARGATHAPAAVIRAGAYDIVRYNGTPLPTQTHVAMRNGWGHVARLERGALLLKPDGRFRVVVFMAHDYRELTSRWPLGPVVDFDVKGRWVREGAAIRLLPDLPRRQRLARPLLATPTATGLRLAYVVDTPSGPRRLVLEMRYDPKSILL